MNGGVRRWLVLLAGALLLGILMLSPFAWQRWVDTRYTPAIYTPEGMAWIDDNTMSTVLLRHQPELAPFLNQVDNAFAPWPRA